MMGLQEFLALVAIITALSVAGLWPQVIRALRELRGEPLGDPPGEPPASLPELDLAYKLLGLAPSAPWSEVEKAYRQKAKRHHPDLGGDADAMRALNDAYAAIKQARAG